VDRTAIRQLAVAAITGAGTYAGQRVFSPLTFATWDQIYPVVIVRTPREHKESLVRGQPQFNVTTTISVVGRVQRNTEADAEADIETLGLQIEQALFGNYALVLATQQFPTVEVKTTVTAEGKQWLGEVELEISAEFYQGFDPVIPDVAVTEVRINTDLTSVYDATGNYPNPPFPGSVQPAPRTEGPDGRNEGAGLDIFPSQ